MSTFDATFDQTFTGVTTVDEWQPEPDPIEVGYSPTPPPNGIYGAFRAKSGLIRVRLLDGGDAQAVDINAVGSLKYEFDLVPDSPNVEAVQALYNRVEIEIFQYSFTGQDLFARLRDATTGGAAVPVTLYVGDDRFRFFVQTNDIGFDKKARMISLDCRVMYDPQATVLEVFDRIESSNPLLLKEFLPNPDEPDETLDAAGVADWIGYAMKTVFLNNDESIVLSARSGSGVGYTDKNYSSFLGGIPNNRVSLIMARMTDPPFRGFADPVPQDGFLRLKEEGVTIGPGIGGTVKEGDLLVLTFPVPSVRVVTEVVDENKIISTFASGSEATGHFKWQWSEMFSTGDIKALPALQELAAIEGAVFGYGFNRNFYLNRIQDAEPVDIKWQDVTEADIDPYYNPFGKGFVRQLARSLSDIEGLELNEGAENYGIWPVASGEWQLPIITDGMAALAEDQANPLEINLKLAPGYPFLSQALGQPAQNRLLGGYTTDVNFFEDFEPSLALCRTGLRSFKRALSSDGSGIIVEFTCFGIRSVKPWNIVRFADGPDEFTGKDFRPTSIEYDIVRDLVTVKAYQIFESDIPEPDLSVTAIGESGSSGAVTFQVLNNNFVQAAGQSGSSGEATFRKVMLASAMGESSASGEVATKVDASFFIQAFGGAQAAGEITILNAIKREVEGSASATGEVTTSVDTGADPAINLNAGAEQISVELLMASTEQYAIYRNTSSPARNGTLVASGLNESAFPYTDTGLTTGVTYYYEVQDGNGTWSNEASTEPF